MMVVYLLITAAVIAVAGKIVARISNLCEDFKDYYQDFNRYMDNRVPAGTGKR